jgi:hypothetical protein
MPQRLPRRLLVLVSLAITLAALRTPTARAQEVIDAKSAAILRDKYLADLDTVHVKVLALATAIPEDKYAWRPAPGVRSVSEVLMHLASEWLYYAPQSVGGKPPADFGPPRETLPKMEKIAGKSEVIGQLEKGWSYAKAQISSADPAALTQRYAPWNVSLVEAAFGMTGDQHEHLGQLIAYARTNGIKPPWSK